MREADAGAAGRYRRPSHGDVDRCRLALPECRDHGIPLEGPARAEGPHHQPRAHLPEAISDGVAKPPRSYGRPNRESDMPYATTDDGVRLYSEETGSGTPVIFVHEFAGDLRSWEPQIRHFGKRYRAVVYNARGFPPSDVPEQVSSYSQARAADDILAVLDHIG